MEIEITILTIKMEILREFFSVICLIIYTMFTFSPASHLPHFSLLPPVPLPPPILPGSHPVVLPAVRKDGCLLESVTSSNHTRCPRVII